MRQVLYYAPGEVGEAVALLAQHGSRATILAGGTDLVPQINYNELKPHLRSTWAAWV
jgi:CO/xanthine dehydrogenase FAD-binding subunit